MRPFMITALALSILVVLSLMIPKSAHPDDSPCQTRCSLTYTKEVRACEHEPACLAGAHQKYDACVAKCEKK